MAAETRLAKWRSEGLVNISLACKPLDINKHLTFTVPGVIKTSPTPYFSTDYLSAFYITDTIGYSLQVCALVYQRSVQCLHITLYEHLL